MDFESSKARMLRIKEIISPRRNNDRRHRKSKAHSVHDERFSNRNGSRGARGRPPVRGEFPDREDIFVRDRRSEEYKVGREIVTIDVREYLQGGE